MDNEVLAQIVHTLDTIHNRFVLNETRIKAQEYCNSIKEHPLSPIYGRHLAHIENNQSNAVRHFGLQLLEHAIEFKWNDGTYNDDEKQQIKQAVIQLIEEVLRSIQNEQSFIKSKAAKIFAGIAKKEWPLRWGDMDQLLQGFYNKSVGSLMSPPTTQEITLLIHSYLAEETEIRDSLQCVIVSSNVLRIQYPNGVKSEGGQQNSGKVTIMFGDDPNNEGWLIRWIRSLEQTVGEWQRQKQLQDPSPQIIIIQEKLSTAILNTLATTLDWILTRSIVESNVVPILCNCLLIDCYEIRMKAIECLVIIFSRNLGAEDRAIVLEPIFEGTCLNLLYNAYNKIQPSGQEVLIDDDEYLYVKRFAEAIAELGEKHICHKNNSVIPTHFSNEQKGLPLMLLELFAKRLSNASQSSEPVDSIAMHYNDLDFDSLKDRRIFDQSLRFKIVELIKSVALLQPIEIFSWMVNRIQVSFNVIPSNVDLDVDGVLKLDSRFYVIFEAEMTLMESIVIGLGKLIKQLTDEEIENVNNNDKLLLREQIINGLNNLLQMLLGIEYEDLSMIHRYLAALAAFEEILQIDSNLLFQVLQKMFKFAVFCPPGYSISSNSSLPPTITRLRVGALTALIRFGVVMPDVLMHVNEIIRSDKRLVTGREKGHFQELLLSIIYFSKVPFEQKQPLFDSIIGPVISEYNSPGLVGCIESIQGFMDSIGLSFLVTVVDEMKQRGVINLKSPVSESDFPVFNKFKSKRNKIAWLLIVTLTWLRRTTDFSAKKRNDTAMNESLKLWQPYIPVMLTFILGFIRRLHQVWNVETWREVPIELHSILLFSKEEKAKAIDMQQKVIMLDSQHSINGMIDTIKKWLVGVRIDSYYILGRLPVIGPDFYKVLPNITESLTQSLFENADFINNIHWKMLLNILDSSKKEPSMLSGLLPQLLKYIDEKLLTEWNALTIKGVHISTLEETKAFEESSLDIYSDEFEEIFDERILKELTRAYLDVVEPIFESAGKKVGGAETSEGGAAVENDKLKEYVLDYIPIAEPLLTSLCHLMTYKDSVSCVRAVQLCARILPNLIKREGLREFVGKGLLTSALHALNDGYHKEFHPVIVSLITDIYIELRPLSSVPFETFSSLLNMNYEKLQKFEIELSQAAESKKRKVVVKKFLEGITGVSKGEWFKIPTSKNQNTSSKKQLVGNYVKPKIGVLDVVDDPEQVGLTDLFD
ncbi:10492_t:CDS:10 [Funneliformis geosporum]|nr:10492_t:CDS:10 [Funneliformis geosporum]